MPPAQQVQSTLHAYAPLFRDVYRFKRMLYNDLFRRISFVGDHLLRTTEHLQQCYAYRIRSQPFYNEVMGCLETVADECTQQRDALTSKSVLHVHIGTYVHQKRAFARMVDKLRYICRHQGVSQFAHLADIEFACTVSDWWATFVHTAFIPLAYNVYRVQGDNVHVVKLNDPFDASTKPRFHSSYTQPHANRRDTDVQRIRALLHQNSLLEHRCYIIDNSTSAPTSSTALTALGLPKPAGAPAAPAVSLVEYINGARVYVPVGKHVVAMSGYFRNDSFQMMSNHVPLLSKTRQLQQLIKTNSVIPDAFTLGWTQQLSLRDQLVYDVRQLNDHCIHDFQRLQQLKSKTISTLVKDFLSSPLYVQREILTLFLLTEHYSDTQYLAYLMYDMISQESYLLKPQPLAEEIYNNLHWVVKKRFRVVIENINQFTKQLSNFTETDINYESRILLLKAPDAVKKKAMEKLKEVQSKSGNDTNHKAQQYLDGLLRIPFGIYKREHMFTFLRAYRDRLHMYCEQYCHAVSNDTQSALYQCHQRVLDGSKEDTLTFNRIDEFLSKTTSEITTTAQTSKYTYDRDLLHKYLSACTYTDLSRLVTKLKKQLAVTQLEYPHTVGSKTKTRKIRVRRKVHGVMQKLATPTIVDDLMAFSDVLHETDKERWTKMLDAIPYKAYDPHYEMQRQFYEQVFQFKHEWETFRLSTKSYMEDVDDILSQSVFGHANAKRSIKQVIAQWITGDLKGYCFGFEGAPGTGKTSLAKNGLSKCLVDINGEKRPFAFIALGGSSNGSTLEGHSYTYVGSTWGRIVDILMETACMNPIIYIDELDKISRTEHGRELVGLLTHITDSTQNDEFMDKYFAGVKIDLSRVLFVFSYNDPDLLDPILRDRIHTVRFSPLKQADKHEVCRLHLVPEILKTVGLSADDIVFPSDVIDFIIDHYTAEGGVRRLKEKLFEICRDLNIRHMVDEGTYTFPYTVTCAFLQDDLFAEHPIVRNKKILETPRVGLVNGMYATTLGVGGITIIECFVVPKTSFMALELTGQQGDVMKESMSVAKTVAWNLLTEATKNELYAKSKDNSYGLHIHCPDGGTPKDGPSAGTAITVSILSSLLGYPVNNKVAITGEIDLNGQVCQIGGLDTKVRGAKKAGVTTVLFPKSNEHDLQTIQKHYSPFADGTLAYVMVETIWDVLPYVFPEVEYGFMRF